jgi:hypothetical protein
LWAECSFFLMLKFVILWPLGSKATWRLTSLPVVTRCELCWSHLNLSFCNDFSDTEALQREDCSRKRWGKTLRPTITTTKRQYICFCFVFILISINLFDSPSCCCRRHLLYLMLQCLYDHIYIYIYIYMLLYILFCSFLVKQFTQNIRNLIYAPTHMDWQFTDCSMILCYFHLWRHAGRLWQDGVLF